MKQTAQQLIELIKKTRPLLEQVTESDAIIKPQPAKWSKKEILGHLIDSASNNHHKFIRTIEKDGVNFPPYDQNVWVNVQQYQNVPWTNLINLWEVYNLHLAHIIAHTEARHLKNKIVIGESKSFDLEFIMTDYVEHLKHHLKQILTTADFLESKFRMVY